jgi:6-phosphogluconolactonase
MIYKNKEILIFKDIGEITDCAVKLWADISEKAIKDRGSFTVALSGGRTPVSLHKALADESGLPWDRTHIFIVDERFVPFDHEDSNYSMIDSALLKHVEIPRENIHPVITEGISPGTSAERYEKDIISFFKTSNTEVPQFDLILLGLGVDGHTASLFPDTPALKEKGHLTAVTPSGGSRKERITLTFPIINNADNIIFMITGEDKADVAREVIEEKSPLPAAMVRPEKGKLYFLLDGRAGSLLSG